MNQYNCMTPEAVINRIFRQYHGTRVTDAGLREIMYNELKLLKETWYRQGIKEARSILLAIDGTEKARETLLKIENMV